MSCCHRACLVRMKLVVFAAASAHGFKGTKKPFRNPLITQWAEMKQNEREIDEESDVRTFGDFRNYA